MSGYRGGRFQVPVLLAGLPRLSQLRGRTSQTAERRIGRIYEALLRQRRMATLPDRPGADAALRKDGEPMSERNRDKVKQLAVGLRDDPCDHNDAKEEEE